MKRLLGYLAAALVIIIGQAAGRTQYTNRVPVSRINIDLPYATLGVHNIGKIAMTVTNFGIIGNGDNSFVDPLTGDRAPSLNYPRGFKPNYLDHAALWIGARKWRDTLASTADGLSYSEVHEFWPDAYPEGDLIFRSNKDPEAPEYDSSISNQDFIAVYYDTLTDPSFTGYDYYTGERHRPIDVEVTQKSYSWGYDYAEDFVIIDYQIVYRGATEIDEMYLGFFVDPDIGTGNGFVGGDDICGFQRTVPSKYIYGLIDTVDVVWAADNNGDPVAGGSLQGLDSPTAAMGIKVLRTPNDDPDFAFNWWVPAFPENDWGPRQITGTEEPVREFIGGLGTPYGDKEKFYMMAQREFDYNQVTTAFDHSQSGWLPPPDNANQIASGAEIRFLVSCGPFRVRQGDILPLTIAFVMGQDFYATKLGVIGYWKYRDFTDLGLNTVWASWVFDNPGIDTDGDGYRGKSYIKVYDSVLVGDGGESPDSQWVPTYAETLYYSGDGVPDFQGANPPPVPKMRLNPRISDNYTGEIEIRWNGRVAETTEDRFSQIKDFEGYRVYLSISERDDDFMLLSSYDLDDYDRFVYNSNRGEWDFVDSPFTLEQLRRLYGSDFEPLEYYDEEHNFQAIDRGTGQLKAYYFRRHDWNQSDYRDTTLIHKIYPDQPYPSTLDLDSAAMFYPEELTEDGYLKYFEYRYVIRNLLPSQKYYVAVTTFDYGYPQRELTPQEASPSLNMEPVYAQNATNRVVTEALNVIVYPNPYRIDAGYEERFEGWEHPELPREYNRKINFTNLPPKCTIRIFTIDGDLVRVIEHDEPANSGTAMIESWDLINRNKMITVSGIYYYVVESEYGSQIGKLVIIR